MSVSVMKCRYCGNRVRIRNVHHCASMRRSGHASRSPDGTDNDFFVSLAVAEASDNWMLGALAGGSVVGGIIGESITNSIDSSSSSSSNDFSPGGGDFSGGGSAD